VTACCRESEVTLLLLLKMAIAMGDGRWAMGDGRCTAPDASRSKNVPEKSIAGGEGSEGVGCGCKESDILFSLCNASARRCDIVERVAERVVERAVERVVERVAGTLAILL
jgi:hypothetical protein